MIQIGQKAPEFSLPDQDGKIVRLGDFADKQNVLLIMYPGDDTPGCTTQLCSVRDNFDDFAAHDTVVLGINHQSAESHKKFVNKNNLKNPLLVDEGRKVIGEYDAVGSFIGKESTKRSVILIDKQGIIQYIWRGLPEHSEIHEQLEKLK